MGLVVDREKDVQESVLPTHLPRSQASPLLCRRRDKSKGEPGNEATHSLVTKLDKPGNEATHSLAIKLGMRTYGISCIHVLYFLCNYFYDPQAVDYSACNLATLIT